jgi:cytochrome c oxidase subunit II
LSSARSSSRTKACGWTAFAAASTTVACAGPQSALDPAGRGAEQIATLFWWMAAGAAVIWAVMVGLTIHAARARAEPHSRREATLLIIGGGAVLPTLVLGVLLASGLSLLPELMAPAPEGSLKIAVSGEQWWWRVRYLPPGGEPIELANEIRLPLGEPVQLELESPDVIHSFWIPSLGGKMDMIPGRRTRLALHPTRAGRFRGVCAEYCGASHAFMGFAVVVEEKQDFRRWLVHQATAATPPTHPAAERGQHLFLANGCGACHTIRGTPAAGVVGPDLTHLGSRESLAAGLLRNGPAELARWLAAAEDLKPGVHMPSFGMLPPEDVRALAAYMDGLE